MTISEEYTQLLRRCLENHTDEELQERFSLGNLTAIYRSVFTEMDYVPRTKEEIIYLLRVYVEMLNFGVRFDTYNEDCLNSWSADQVQELYRMLFGSYATENKTDCVRCIRDRFFLAQYGR